MRNPNFDLDTVVEEAKSLASLLQAAAACKGLDPNLEAFERAALMLGTRIDAIAEYHQQMGIERWRVPS